MTKDKDRMEEFWVPIPKFSNYAVSNYGNVRNVRTGRDLKPAMRKSGYLQINIRNYYGKKTFRVHRLVAQAFFKHYEEGQQVYHINGVLHDNAIINLTMRSDL